MKFKELAPNVEYAVRLSDVTSYKVVVIDFENRYERITSYVRADRYIVNPKGMYVKVLTNRTSSYSSTGSVDVVEYVHLRNITQTWEEYWTKWLEFRQQMQERRAAEEAEARARYEQIMKAANIQVAEVAPEVVEVAEVAEVAPEVNEMVEALIEEVEIDAVHKAKLTEVMNQLPEAVALLTEALKSYKAAKSTPKVISEESVELNGDMITATFKIPTPRGDGDRITAKAITETAINSVKAYYEYDLDNLHVPMIDDIRLSIARKRLKKNSSNDDGDLYSTDFQWITGTRMPLQITKATYRGVQWSITLVGPYVNLKFERKEGDQGKEKVIKGDYWFDSVADALVVIEDEIKEHVKQANWWNTK